MKVKTRTRNTVDNNDDDEEDEGLKKRKKEQFEIPITRLVLKRVAKNPKVLSAECGESRRVREFAEKK